MDNIRACDEGVGEAGRFAEHFHRSCPCRIATACSPAFRRKRQTQIHSVTPRDCGLKAGLRTDLRRRLMIMTKRLAVIGGLLSLIALTTVVLVAGSASSDPAHWPQWRGPFFNGVAKGAAPVELSDTKNIKWKIAIPGRGFSTPVIWGDRIFLTTAVPTGKVAQPASPATTEQSQNPPALNPGAPNSGAPNSGGSRGQGRGGPGGGAGANEEQKFVVM